MPVIDNPKTLRCAFCYDREQGKHGEVKREWAEDWKQYFPVCRKHSWAGLPAANDKDEWHQNDQ